MTTADDVAAAMHGACKVADAAITEREATIDQLTAALDALLPEHDATEADAFVESVGVNALLKNRAGVYGNINAVIDWCELLGVRHFRDRLIPTQVSQQAAYAAMHASGMQAHATIGVIGNDAVAIVAALTKAAEEPEFYSSFGGPNEPNADHAPGWVAATVAHQRTLFITAKGNPRLTNIPVVGPALKDNVPDLAGDFAQLAAAGIGQWIDHPDFHHYPKGITPTNGLAEHIRLAESLGGGDPFNTESGYNTGVGITGHGNPIPEWAQAIYLPRLLLEHYGDGVARSFLFELLDDPDPNNTDWEAHFGLVRCPTMEPSTWSAKPAHDSVAWLLAELADPGPPFTPAPLRVSIDAGLEVDYHLFGKRDGTYRLALWQDATVYDVQTREPLAVPPIIPVTIQTATTRQEITVGAEVELVSLP